jgi:hypothetical protein
MENKNKLSTSKANSKRIARTGKTEVRVAN